MKNFRIGHVGLFSPSSGGEVVPVGSILGVSIDPDGWTASITISGLTTGGNYSFGLGPNNTVDGPGANPKLVLNVTSKGYDDAGNEIVVSRLVYGDKPLRKPYPNQLIKDETDILGNVIIRVSLSDYVWAKDKSGAGNSGTDVAVSILSGLYTQGVNSSLAWSGNATNGSTPSYPKVIANWAWPGYERIVGSSFTLRVVAFHRDAQERRPVRAVKFIATDGINTVETIVTEPIVDDSIPDESPIVEYVGTLSTDTLNQDAEITCNFVAYPWVGDSGSIMDSSVGAPAPSPLVGPIKMLCDKNGTYGVTKAKVDSVNGNDLTGAAYDEASYDYATAMPFATIGKAAAAIASLNNSLWLRYDAGAGEIELAPGNYAWLGSVNSYGNVPKTWVEIKPGPGVSRDSVLINASLNDKDISDRVKITNCTITSSAAFTFHNIGALWFNKCKFDSPTTNQLISCTSGTSVVYATHNDVVQLRQGFLPVNPGVFVLPALVRGNDLTGFKRSILVYTCVGNVRSSSYAAESILFVTDQTNQTIPVSDNGILAFNQVYGWHATSIDLLSVGNSNKQYVKGFAVVQNLFEASVFVSAPIGFVGSGEISTLNTPIDNVILWHNTMVGSRFGFAYNSSGSTTKHRRFWSVVGNSFDTCAVKSDVLSPGDGNRIGGWPVLFGVGASGNADAESVLGAGSALSEFFGISSIQVYEGSPSTWQEYVDRRSYADGANGVGGGDYRLQPSSPLIGLPIRIVLPYDLNNTPRTILNNAAGAYAI